MLLRNRKSNKIVEQFCCLKFRDILLSKYNRRNLNYKTERNIVDKSQVLCPPTSSQKVHRIYSCGLSEHGGLGLKKSNDTNIPKYLHKPVRHFFAEENDVCMVQSGFGFSLFAVKSKHLFKVFGCGLNTDSQIGYHDPRRNNPLEIILSPAPINLPIQGKNTKIISIAAGRAHSVIVTDNEGVFTLGSNCYGQCGRPIIEDEKYSGSQYVHNIKSLNNEKIIEAVGGQDHTLFLTESGRVYSCGLSADGQTGLGTSDSVWSPTCLKGEIEGEVVIKVAGKSDTALALSSNGDVFGWGNSEYSQLTSIGGDQQVYSPRKLEKLSGIGKIIDIAAGGSFCIVLNECGDVFVWGFGILGAGPNVLKSEKVIMLPRTLFGCNEFQPDTRVRAVYCGLSHLAAITNHSHLYMWGVNKHGCLGIGHVRNQYFPYKVALSALVSQVSCGVDHTMILARPFD